MNLENILFTQGFGSRRECRALVLSGRVMFHGKHCSDPEEDFETEGMIFSVDGRQWPYRDKAVIAMNKPAGYECSQKPVHHPSVMRLLPAPLVARGVQPVGRLDEDTTGLLIFTDDGQLQHRLIHPKKHVKKTYRVGLKHEASGSLCRQLLEGVLLKDGNETVCADSAELADSRTLLLTISAGKYHQVKRMVAAAGNRVEALQRVAFGALSLPENLAPGEWMWIRPEDVLGSKIS